MTYPLIAAIVVNWNGCQLLRDALLSLGESDYKNLKIIVVDNGSIDDSVNMVAEHFPDVEVIINSDNLGFAKGNNQGIDFARSIGAEYLFFLNNDAVVAINTISKLYEFIKKNPQCAAVSPYIFYHRSKLNDRSKISAGEGQNNELIWFGGGRVILPLGFIAHRFIRKKFIADKYGPSTSDYLTGCAILARSDIVYECGGFDESYGIYSEDVDLSLKIRKKGWQLWVLPTAHSWHKVSSSSGGELTPQKAYLRTKSNVILLKKHLRRCSLPLTLFSLTVLFFAYSIRLVTIGKGGIIPYIIKGAYVGMRTRVN